jgi:hypothetical protein
MLSPRTINALLDTIDPREITLAVPVIRQESTGSGALRLHLGAPFQFTPILWYFGNLPIGVFEVAHLDRDGGLADRQRNGGLRKTAMDRDSVKYLELVEVGHS